MKDIVKIGDFLANPEIDFYDCDLFGLKCLFTASRIPTDEINGNLRVYHLRDDDSKELILERYVGVNHYGSIISVTSIPQLDNDESGEVYIDVNPGDLIIHDEYAKTVPEIFEYVISYKLRVLNLHDAVQTDITSKKKDIKVVIVNTDNNFGNYREDIIKQFGHTRYNLDIYKFIIEKNMDLSTRIMYIEKFIRFIREGYIFAFTPNIQDENVIRSLCKYFDVKTINLGDINWCDDYV